VAFKKDRALCNEGIRRKKPKHRCRERAQPRTKSNSLRSEDDKEEAIKKGLQESRRVESLQSKFGPTRRAQV
jgi:hypothetical protein